jgi:hypothetical protein
LPERRDTRVSVRIVRDPGEHADAPHPLALLRARRKWPRRRAAEQGANSRRFNRSISIRCP